MSFRSTAATLFKARFPLVSVTTWEEERVLAELGALAQDESLIRTRRKLYVWSLTAGMAEIGEGGRTDTRAPVRALELVAETDEPAIFVFKDMHVYFTPQHRTPEANQVIRKIRDLVPVLKSSPQPKNVVFVSPSSTLPLELEKDVTIIDFDLPREEEIRAVLEQIIEVNRPTGRITFELDPDEAKRLVNAALGLTLQEAENAFARAMVDNGRLDASDVEVILEEKRQVIKKTQILEFVQSDVTFDDVGGLENLKRWLAKRGNSWLGAARRYRLPPPKGILITGVPGCGKSLTAKCTSMLWHVPLLRLDVGRIFSGLVGSSEENMRSALRTAEAIAPSILWIDEIEKGFAGIGSAGDSGTATRVFGTFLTWMQEKKSPVFVIATANSIRELPPEFLRKGRFDEIFFVDLPTRSERLPILRVHLQKRLQDPTVIGDFSLTDDVLGDLADASEGYSGAEIEQAVLAALFDAFAEQRAVEVDDFARAISNMVPLSVTQAEQIRATREWANVRAVAATAQEDREAYVEAGAGSDGDVRDTRGGRAVDF